MCSRSSAAGCERAAVTVLRQGDGPSLQVYRLSEQLVTTGHLSVTSEKFTPAMDLAVKAFQAQNGLTVDGVFGPASAGKMRHLVGGRRVTSIVVHHTAGSRQNTAAEIDAFHRAQHPAWGGIAYQYVIRQPRNGAPLVVIERGRAHAGGAWLAEPGTHVYGGVNATSVALCVVGDFSAETIPTPLWRSVVGVLSTWCVAWDLRASAIFGHHEVEGNATSCPGDRVDLEQLRSDVRRVLDAMPMRSA